MKVWSDKPVVRDLFFSPLWILLYFATGGFLLLFLPLVILSRRCTKYTLTDQRIIVERGILSKTIDDVELYRIKDTKLEQGLIDRMLGIGSVQVNTADLSGNWRIKKIVLPRDVREKIRRSTESLKHNKNIRIHTE